MLLVLQLNNLLGEAPELVEVPDVVGQTQASGTAEIEAAGFGVVLQYANSTSVRAGRIISQSPVAGSMELGGTDVTITVSRGPAISWISFEISAPRILARIDP